MGGALLHGMINSGVLARNIIVIEPNFESVPDDLNLRIMPDFHQENVDYIAPNVIIFAVKPQVIESILPVYKQYAASALFVSIIAGKTISFFEKYLGHDAAIVRTMPNLPAIINKGMTIFYHKPGKISENQRNNIRNIFGSVGEVSGVEDESLMDAVTAISGSGPAYLFHFIECLTEAGISLGLPEDLSKTLALRTVEGSASLAVSSEKSAYELRQAVTSPKGTTEAALKVMMHEDKLKKLISDSAKAAYLRSKELSE